MGIENRDSAVVDYDSDCSDPPEHFPGKDFAQPAKPIDIPKPCGEGRPRLNAKFFKDLDARKVALAAQFPGKTIPKLMRAPTFPSSQWRAAEARGELKSQPSARWLQQEERMANLVRAERAERAMQNQQAYEKNGYAVMDSDFSSFYSTVEPVVNAEVALSQFIDDFGPIEPKG